MRENKIVLSGVVAIAALACWVILGPMFWVVTTVGLGATLLVKELNRETGSAD